MKAEIQKLNKSLEEGREAVESGTTEMQRLQKKLEGEQRSLNALKGRLQTAERNVDTYRKAIKGQSRGLIEEQQRVGRRNESILAWKAAFKAQQENIKKQESEAKFRLEELEVEKKNNQALQTLVKEAYEANEGLARGFHEEQSAVEWERAMENGLGQTIQDQKRDIRRIESIKDDQQGTIQLLRGEIRIKEDALETSSQKGARSLQIEKKRSTRLSQTLKDFRDRHQAQGAELSKAIIDLADARLSISYLKQDVRDEQHKVLGLEHAWMSAERINEDLQSKLESSVRKASFRAERWNSTAEELKVETKAKENLLAWGKTLSDKVTRLEESIKEKDSESKRLTTEHKNAQNEAVNLGHRLSNETLAKSSFEASVRTLQGRVTDLELSIAGGDGQIAQLNSDASQEKKSYEKTIAKKEEQIREQASGAQGLESQLQTDGGSPG